MSGPAPLFSDAHTRKLLPFLLRAHLELEPSAQASKSLARIRRTEALHRGAEQPAKRRGAASAVCQTFGAFFFTKPLEFYCSRLIAALMERARAASGLYEQHLLTASSTAPLRLRCGVDAARALEQQGASLLAAEHAPSGQLAAHCMVSVPGLASLSSLPSVCPRRLSGRRTCFQRMLQLGSQTKFCAAAGPEPLRTGSPRGEPTPNVQQACAMA